LTRRWSTCTSEWERAGWHGLPQLPPPCTGPWPQPACVTNTRAPVCATAGRACTPFAVRCAWP
jgi:hypothetical protein